MESLDLGSTWDEILARREDAGLPGDVGIERALHIPERELGAELHGDVDIVELHGLVDGKAEATDLPHGRSLGHFESRCDAEDVLADENSSDAQVQTAYGQLKLAIEGLKDAEQGGSLSPRASAQSRLGGGTTLPASCLR